MKKLVITTVFFSLYINYVAYAKQFDLDGKWTGTYTAYTGFEVMDGCNITYSLANSSIKNGVFYWVAKKISKTRKHGHRHEYKQPIPCESGTPEIDSFTAPITISSKNQTLSFSLFGSDHSPSNIVTLKISDDGKSLSGGARIKYLSGHYTIELTKQD